MKKWSLYLATLCMIPAAVNAQVHLPIVHPLLKNDLGINHLPPINKSGCPACSPGMSCDGTCCMYPTEETIGQVNYFIYNKCEPLKNLHFKFEVTKEWTAEYDELKNSCFGTELTQKLNTTEGIVVQFNCGSKDAPNALIQYLFYVQGTAIYPHIQYAGGTPDKVDHDWSAATTIWPITLPKANSLAKGWVFEVELTSDNSGYVNGATFTATDPSGKKYSSAAPKSSMFPIRLGEVQTNIVSANGHYVHFTTGGEGTISYKSSESICVEGGNYGHCALSFGDTPMGTCETSNASYDKLSSCCSKAGDWFSQTTTVK